MNFNSHSNIAIILGTKAELIKTMPLMLELQKEKKDYWFIHTGQHPVRKACQEFGIKQPDFILSKEPKISTKFWSKINQNTFLWFLSMIFKIRKEIRKLKPKYVIYHGDTMSTAAGAIASSSLLNFLRTWKNVHLEAGLRSKSLFEPFPEEISRRISDSFSDILLAVSELSVQNLKNEKTKGKIILIGNTIIDSANIAYNKFKKQSKKQRMPYVLINIHRHENLTNKKRLRKIVEIIKSIKIKAIWPLHHNTELFLNKYGLMHEIKNKKNIQIVPLADYFEFIYLTANCKYLIADGGSIQEESLIFNKPCIILRNKTERQEGLYTGINFLTKLNVKKTQEIIRQIEKNEVGHKKISNPYGKKGLSKEIIKILK